MVTKNIFLQRFYYPGRHKTLTAILAEVQMTPLRGYNANKYSNGRVCCIDLKIIPFSVLVPGHYIFSILRYYYVMYNNLFSRIICIHTIILLECLWKLNICCYRVVQINADWIIYSCTRATSEVQHFIFRTPFITIVYVIITLITLHFI